MKRTYILLITATLFFTCSSKNDGNLSFFNGLEFKVEKGEKLISVDELVKEEYSKLLTESTVQIPLYRCLKANEYKIFIGIPYDTSFEQLSDFLLPSATLLEEEKSEDALYKKYKKGDYYISEYVYQRDKNLLVVFGISYFKESIAFLSAKNLSNRLKYSQNEK